MTNHILFPQSLFIRKNCLDDSNKSVKLGENLLSKAYIMQLAQLNSSIYFIYSLRTKDVIECSANLAQRIVELLYLQSQ